MFGVMSWNFLSASMCSWACSAESAQYQNWISVGAPPGAAGAAALATAVGCAGAAAVVGAAGAAVAAPAGFGVSDVFDAGADRPPPQAAATMAAAVPPSP